MAMVLNPPTSNANRWADAPPEVVMTYEQFYQSVVLSYINHDGNPARFFDDVVAALNQFREEKQAAQQSVQSDGAICEHQNSFPAHDSNFCPDCLCLVPPLS